MMSTTDQWNGTNPSSTDLFTNIEMSYENNRPHYRLIVRGKKEINVTQ